MTDIDARLIRCFASVFPKLRASEIQQATLESVDDWDSIATARLLAVVSEEFSLPLDFDEIDELTSYAGIRSWVMREPEK